MKFGCVVFQILLDVFGGFSQWYFASVSSLGSYNEPDLTGRVGRNCCVRIFDGRKGLANRIDEWLDQIQMKPHALSLGAYDSPLSKTLVHGIIKRRLEQDRRWSDRIGRIRNDDIKRILVLVHKFRSIHDFDTDSRIVVSLGQGRQMLFGYRDDSLVDFAFNDFFHTRMFGNLPQNASVATSNDENLFGVRMGKQRDVGNHFLVGMLVAGRHLDDSVQHEDRSVILRLKDQDILKVALKMIQHLFHFERHGLARPKLAPFVEPSVNNQVFSVEAHCSVFFLFFYDKRCLLTLVSQ
mmetsp:Transcript_8144/g.15028  ORF Transcript_8144/g.15028 Transcript_8144/m.15028 type:complete len:295 (+) Transcript_8144:176-1060(+)